MQRKSIKMTEGFRKAHVKAGQLTDEDATGEWLRPEGSKNSPEADEEFRAILNRISKTASVDQEQ